MVHLRSSSRSAIAAAAAIALMAMLVASLATARSASAAAGDFDTTFAGDGVAETPALPTMNGGFATKVLMLPDGRFLTVGHLQFNSGPADLAVQRHNADGTLDTTFSGDGVAVINVPSTFGTYGVGVGVQPSGKVIAVARLSVELTPSRSQFAVYRFNDDGTLDQTFDGDSGTGNGVVHFHAGDPGPPNPTDAPWSAFVEPNGRIVVAGESAQIGVSDASMVMARLTPDGLLDTTFSGDGRLVFDPTLYNERGLSLASHPLGGYVVGGVGRRQTIPQAYVQALFRVTDAGTLDAAFTGDAENTSPVPGLVLVAIGADLDDQAAAWALTVQPDGKIVTGGLSQNGAATTFLPYVARFTATGAFDPGFGSGGRSFPPFPDEDGQINDLAIDSNGRVYAAGSAYGGLPQIGAVARLSAAGMPDAGYGGDGVAPVTQLGFASGIDLTSDGSQIVTGSSGASVGLTTVRLLGDPPPAAPTTPPVAAPFATISSPKAKRVKRKRLKQFSGTAGPAGSVAKVEIALQKIDRRLLKQRKRCLWLVASKPRFKKIKAIRRTCSKPRFLQASGRENWRFRLRQPLPKSRYRLLVRVTLVDGRQHETFTVGQHNLRSFSAR